ncbi:MAG: (d)CMP kinase [Bacteroidota bacterium]
MANQDSKIIIAMDGYAGCGKSTTALEVAKRLNYNYLDTGAMYRAVTLYFLRHNLDWNNSSDIQTGLNSITLHFEPNPETGKSPIFLNGENVSQEIRGMAVSQKVSQVSAVPEVRRFLVAQQKKIGEEKNIVAEGRDIGTVVFPDAELKIFLEADMDARVVRRKAQLAERGQEVSEKSIQENLKKRDHIDTTREDSPLRKAKDALTLDTSNTSFEEQVAWVLEKVEKTRSKVTERV